MIETKRFILRPMTEKDINPDYISWWNAADIQAGMNMPARQWQRFHALRHIRRFNNRDSFHFGIFHKGGPLLGFFAVFLNFNQQTATVNIMVGNKQYWGKKIPDETAPAVFDFIFSHQDIVKIKTETIGSNRSSIACQKRVGMQVEGVLRQERKGIKGDREDLYLFGLLKTDWQQRDH